MNTEDLDTGNLVMDKWEAYQWNPGMYDAVSIGRILEKITKQRSGYKWKSTYFRIEWIFGPKSGKVSTMKYVYDFEGEMARRREILQDRTNLFDKFYFSTKECK